MYNVEFAINFCVDLILAQASLPYFVYDAAPLLVERLSDLGVMSHLLASVSCDPGSDVSPWSLTTIADEGGGRRTVVARWAAGQQVEGSSMPCMFHPNISFH